MKLQSKLAIGAWSLAATAAVRQWMGTLDYRADFGDPTVDPVHAACRGTKIYVFWHEGILLPLHLRGHCNISMLLSRHWDANVLDRVARMMGFGTVRGSTFHGGSAALRELAARARSGNLTITPDGPRGPCYFVQDGIASLAQLTGRAIVPVSYELSWKWRLKSWDQFQVPLPFARCEVHLGEPVRIPRDASDAERETLRCELETRMKNLTRD